MATSTLTTTLTDDVYLDEPWLSIRWDSVHRYVHSEWKAFATSVEFRAGLMKGLQAIRENHALGYLSDTRKIKVIVRKDVIWAHETWGRLATAAGLKRLGLVRAQAGLGKMTVDEIVALVDDDALLVRAFDSLDAALKWVSGAQVES